MWWQTSGPSYSPSCLHVHLPPGHRSEVWDWGLVAVGSRARVWFCPLIVWGGGCRENALSFKIPPGILRDVHQLSAQSLWRTLIILLFAVLLRPSLSVRLHLSFTFPLLILLSISLPGFFFSLLFYLVLSLISFSQAPSNTDQYWNEHTKDTCTSHWKHTIVLWVIMCTVSTVCMNAWAVSTLHHKALVTVKSQANLH